MKTYHINISRLYTEKDGRGLPAHSFLANVYLDSSLSQHAAEVELHRLRVVYPWPEYHLTLRACETRTTSHSILSTAPQDFLEAHQWAYRSVNGEGAA